MTREINVGLLGLGVVGSGTVAMLRENRQHIEACAGARIHLRKIAVRDPDKPRAVTVDRSLITYNPYEVLDDPRTDIICELIGGVYPTREYVTRALDNGKHVVTANKELLAKEGAGLLRLAAEKRLDFQFEGSVGGGIPIVRALRNALSGNRIDRIVGIVNGTTNYILTQMSVDGGVFQDALREAQASGYAEADPTSDVGGHDAAYKLAILAGLAFGCSVREASVFREGVERVEPADIQCAGALGYAIKLLGIAKLGSDGAVEARVHPTLVPLGDPLAAISGVFNAVVVRGNFVGDVMLSGRGAGSHPTGSAVIGDLIEVCRGIVGGGSSRDALIPGPETAATPIEGIESAYFVRAGSGPSGRSAAFLMEAFKRRGLDILKVEHAHGGATAGEVAALTRPGRESDFLKVIRDLEEAHGLGFVRNWLRAESDA